MTVLELALRGRRGVAAVPEGANLMASGCVDMAVSGLGLNDPTFSEVGSFGTECGTSDLAFGPGPVVWQCPWTVIGKYSCGLREQGGGGAAGRTCTLFLRIIVPRSVDNVYDSGFNLPTILPYVHGCPRKLGAGFA